MNSIKRLWSTASRTPVMLQSVAVMIPAVLFTRGMLPNPADGESVRARSFVLVDKDGKARAELGLNPMNGCAGLFLFNSDGKSVAELVVIEGRNPELQLTGADGLPKMSLRLLGDEQQPCLNLCSTTTNESVPVVTMTVLQPGHRLVPMKGRGTVRGVLRVYDSEGTVTLQESETGHK